MVTGLYAGIFALIYVALSFNVISRRRYHGVPYGDKDIPEMRRAIRVHGNFSEYIPIALLCMMLLEMQGTQAGTIHLFGILLLIGRIAHAYALTKSVFQARVVGTMLTQIVIAVCGVLLLSKGLGF
jgi:uncharacterized membrane protein YecN with MAPEG domain